MYKNETTPGRGYPLPVLENSLEVDCGKLRGAIFAIDEDYLKLVVQMKAFVDRADEYLKEIDDGFKEIDRRQEAFDEEKAEQIRAMREEVAGYLENLGVDANACFVELGERVDRTLAQLRSDVDGEIFRMTSRIPHYGELDGLAGTADSKLPPGNTAPLQYIEGFGFYRYDPDATDPADGETCLMPEDGVGRWLLALPDIDALLSLLPDERAIRRFERTVVPRVFAATANLTWASIPAYGGELVRTISVPGAKVGDPVVVVQPPVLAEGIGYYGFVSASGTVSVRCVNSKSTAVTPAAADWKVCVIGKGGLIHD